MSVRDDSFAAGLILSELVTQCDLAEFSFARVRSLAAQWRSASLDFAPPRATPTEIFAHISVLLTAAATIYWFLFESGRKGRVAHRCKALRTLLEVDTLPLLQSTGVRHGYQHVDERLDGLMDGFVEGAIEPLSLSDLPPTRDCTVLKRLDPGTLVVSILDQSLSLYHLAKEIAALKAKILAVLPRLEERHVFIFSNPGTAG